MSSRASAPGSATADGLTGAPVRSLVAALLASLALVAAWRFAVGPLERVDFLSGWVTALFLALPTLSWLRASHEGDLGRRLTGHVALSLVMLSALAVHVEFRNPTGLLERGLAGGMLALVASLLVGRLLVARGVQRTQAWLTFHVALSWSLFSAALLHGLHVHAHGLVAHWVFAR